MVQPLAGQAALLSRASTETLGALASGGAPPADAPEDALRAGRFVVESEAEDDALLATAQAEYAKEAAKTPTQLVVVPSFGCNLACTYCYPEVLDPSAGGLMAPEIVTPSSRTWIATTRTRIRGPTSLSSAASRCATPPRPGSASAASSRAPGPGRSRSPWSRTASTSRPSCRTSPAGQ